MQKKPTITMDQLIYDGKELELAYQQMARDETREAEALEWADATVGDVN